MPGGTLPSIQVLAGFGSAGANFTWTDISAYVRSGAISRRGTRQMGPLWRCQPGTASIVLKNADGRFDPDNLAGPYVSTSGLQQVVKTYSAPGGFTWTAPANLSGGTVKAEAWGAGGNGAGGGSVTGGGGGGGGGYGAESALAVTAGLTYSGTVAAAGSGANTAISGDSVTVTAHSGANATTSTGGSGAAASGNSIAFAGGGGGTSTGAAGSGGGSSGGSAAPGSAGGSATGSASQPGGAAPAGGGPGGAGGGSPYGVGGSRPKSGPGGGGGGGTGLSFGEAGNGGAGWAGQVRLTYFVAIPAAAASQVIAMVPIAVSAVYNSVTYPLFSGYADAWADTTPQVPGGLPTYAEVTVTATDGFKVLGGITLPAVSALGAGEDTGSRISRILDAAGWPAALRAVDTGDSGLQATTFGDTALNLLQLSADSEIGELYMDAPGNLTFRHRQALLDDARSATPQAVFGDDPGAVQAAGTELPYAAVGRANDDTTLANDVQITRVGGTLQEAADAASQAKYIYPRTYARTDVLLQTDTEALYFASWVLHVALDAEDRFDTLTILPMRDPADLYPQALGREMGDRIQIWRRPPGAIPQQAPWTVTSTSNALDGFQMTVSTADAAKMAAGDQFQLFTSGGAAKDQASWPLTVTAVSGGLISFSPAVPVWASTGDTATQVRGAVVKDVFIRGIDHTFDAAAHTFTTTWTLQSADKYAGFLVLNSAKLSQSLDHGALVY